MDAWTTLYLPAYPRLEAKGERDAEDRASEAFLRLLDEIGGLDFATFDELMDWLEAVSVPSAPCDSSAAPEGSEG